MTYIDESPENLVFSFNDSLPELSEKQKSDIEKVWEEKKAENPRVFNADIFAVNSVSQKNTHVEISLNKCEYKHRIWGAYKKSLPAGVRPTIVNIFVYDESTGEIQFVRRSDKVGVHPNVISNVAGQIDFKENVVENFWEHVADIAIQELIEETELDETPTRDKLKYLGAVYIEEISFMVFIFVYPGRILKLLGDENVEVIRVHKDMVYNFYLKHAEFRFKWLGDGVKVIFKKLSEL